MGQLNAKDIKVSELSDSAIFACFRQMDTDRNYCLEWDEYQACLSSLCADLNLNRQEALSLNILADVDGDGKIDYEEFMKHFKDIVFMLKLHQELERYLEQMAIRLQNSLAPEENAEPTDNKKAEI